MNGKLSFVLVITGFLLQTLQIETYLRARNPCYLISLSSLVSLRSYQFSIFEPEFVGLGAVWKWPLAEWCPIRACLPLCLSFPGSYFPGTVRRQPQGLVKTGRKQREQPISVCSGFFLVSVMKVLGRPGWLVSLGESEFSKHFSQLDRDGRG